MAVKMNSTALDHFNSFANFFSSSNGGTNSASANAGQTTARVKLQRLTKQQYLELSTDVYDELHRRESGTDTPFLLSVESFHMKRNQARQKLATLPATRFTDLASDVFWELKRRYPEFLDQQNSAAEPSSGSSNNLVQRPSNGSGGSATGLGINTGENMLPLSNSGGNFAYNVKQELVNQERSSGYTSNYSINTAVGPPTNNTNSMGSNNNNITNSISSKYINSVTTPSPLTLLSSPRITNTENLRRLSPPLQSMSPPPSAMRSPDDQKAKISSLHRTIRDLQSDLAEKEREFDQKLSQLERKDRDRQKELDALNNQLQDARSALEVARSKPRQKSIVDVAVNPEEVEHLRQLISSLSSGRSETERLREKITELEGRLISSTTNASKIITNKPAFNIKNNGLIPDSLLLYLQRSIDSLLSNSRNNLSLVLGSASDCLIGVNALNTALPPANSILSSISLSIADQETYSIHLYNLNPAAQNLVAAARTHSQSNGFSAISLVDAAASHVNDAFVGLALLVGVKKGDFDPSVVKSVLPLAMPLNPTNMFPVSQSRQINQQSLSSPEIPPLTSQQPPQQPQIQPAPASSGTGLMDRFRNIAGVAGALGASAARAAANQQSNQQALSPPTSIASNLAAFVGRGSPSPAPVAAMPSSTSASTVKATSTTSALKLSQNSSVPSQDKEFLYDDARQSSRTPEVNRAASRSRSRSRSPSYSRSPSRTSRSPSVKARSRSSFSRSENSEYRRRSLDEWSQQPSLRDDDAETGMTSEPYQDRAMTDDDEDPTLARERWEDMQSYLDTDVIDSATSSLNSLMSNIRSAASSPSLIQNISPLLAAGQDLVLRIPSSLPGALRSIGDRILTDLDTDCKTLERIRTRLQREKSDVVLQKERKTLVDAGMGIAKAIRELMGLNMDENDLR